MICRLLSLWTRVENFRFIIFIISLISRRSSTFRLPFHFNKFSLRCTKYRWWVSRVEILWLIHASTPTSLTFEASNVSHLWNVQYSLCQLISCHIFSEISAVEQWLCHIFFKALILTKQLSFNCSERQARGVGVKWKYFNIFLHSSNLRLGVTHQSHRAVRDVLSSHKAEEKWA